MDRCDHIRSSALAFAVEHHAGVAVAIADVVQTAHVFHKFLLGGHDSLTEKEVVEMEEVIRTDEAANLNQPEERTFTGSDPAGG